MQNFIPDTNRFALPAPPDWFLKKLYEFDSSLVIVPSRQSPVYRLAQRRQLLLPEKLVNDALFKESDTKMLASYSLIPVTTIMPTIVWSDPYIFVELNNRAPHRLGGAEAVNRQLEAEDAKHELDTQFKTNQMLDDTAKDAWGMYLKKIGLRSQMYSPKPNVRSSKFTQ